MWQDNLADARLSAEKQNKPIFVDWADCALSTRKQDILNNPSCQLLNKSLINLIGE